VPKRELSPFEATITHRPDALERFYFKQKKPPDSTPQNSKASARERSGYDFTTNFVRNQLEEKTGLFAKENPSHGVFKSVLKGPRDKILSPHGTTINYNLQLIERKHFRTNSVTHKLSGIIEDLFH